MFIYKAFVFYAIIGFRLGLTLEEIALLTNEEIEDHLLHSKFFDKNEIAKRKEGFLLLQIGNTTSLFSGNEAHQKAKELQLVPEIPQLTSLSGSTASPGNMQGIAKVIYTNKDLHKIKKGDIVITTMTRQDFIPYLREVCALVTDEGGIGSHAAIIAREIGLPCIVGIKFGTQVIKDGDLIALDTEKGIVNILKR
ncbi:hypothetical protein J4410_04755 [Candidatus Woesearchaeota archaeon]|nr:hypothetical protein [Candidatus Woesearchaeota archaeon]